MTESPFANAEVQRLARELGALRRLVEQVARGQAVSGAGHSSLDGGSWVVRDSDGNVRQVIGGQSDGTYTTTDLNGPPPPQPDGFHVLPVPGGLKVVWAGTFVGEVPRPADLAWVEVHVDLDPAFVPDSTTRDAALTARGTITFATDDYVPHTVRLVARSTSGRTSVPSGSVTATPAQVGPGDVAPGGIGTVELDDGAVTPPKAATGVTSNLVPDPGFNDAGVRAKRTAAPWGFVEASSLGFANADWAAYCSPTTARAPLTVTGAAGVPVIPGETYFVGYDAARSGSGQGRFSLEVRFWDSSGAEVTPTGEELDPVLTEVRDISSLPLDKFETRDGQVVVHAGAATMTVTVVRQDVAGTSAGNLYLDRVEVRSVTSRSSGGQRVETSPSGVLVYDAAGQPIGSINADGSLSMVSGRFNDGLTYQGEEMADLLNQRARGEVARVDAGAANSPAAVAEVLWLEFEFTALRGRAYKLRSSGLIARNANMTLRVRHTTDGTRPLATSPQLVSLPTPVGQSQFLASDVGALGDGGDTQVRLVVDLVSTDGSTSGYFSPADLALGFSAWVEDVGPRQPPTGGVVSGGGATVKSTTSTWLCTWSRCWSDARYRGTAPMYQGYYDATEGNNFSAFGFNYSSIASALTGATVKKVEVFLYAEHWFYGTGGAVWLGTTSLKAPPGNNVYPADAQRTRKTWHLDKPEGRWVDLGSVGVDIANEMKAGTTGAFVLDARHPNNNRYDYGRFSGQGAAEAQLPKLRITYEKTS